MYKGWKKGIREMCDMGIIYGIETTVMCIR